MVGCGITRALSMNENNLWLERWENREIGFNQEEVNAYLINYFQELNLVEKSTVFVPLCGKSIDISWLLAHGHAVVGVELSQIAVEELFQELGLKANISTLNELTVYQSKGLTLFVGDIFHLNADIIGKIDAIYDRAAMVALSKELRVKYAKHICQITHNAPQLLLCFEYDQSLMNRTPYSVEASEVQKHYAEHYEIKLLTKEPIKGGFKGKLPASDVVWLLKSS